MRAFPVRPGPWTRRTLLSLIGSGLACRVIAGRTPDLGRIFPPDWRRFADPVTEFEVYRLTASSYSSRLPEGRVIPRRNHFLLFWSDRSGAPQAWRMDLKSGESRRLTDAAALDGSSLTLMPDDRSVCFFDGPSLRHMNLSNLREREIYRVPDGWQRCPGSSVTGDGVHAMFGESRSGTCRLRLVGIGTGAAATVLESAGSLANPVGRPKRDQILYRQHDEALWLVNFDGRQNRRLKFAEGGVGPARWGPDGRTILYLHFPASKAELNSIREHDPDENLDTQVAKTSQFVNFGFNSNSSVFAGASRNAAAPDILILLRVARRELTVCEHHATNASLVVPVFSPNSQHIYFTSDKEGKPAIYRVRVDRFVEETDSGPEPL